MQEVQESHIPEYYSQITKLGEIFRLNIFFTNETFVKVTITSTRLELVCMRMVVRFTSSQIA